MRTSSATRLLLALALLAPEAPVTAAAAAAVKAGPAAGSWAKVVGNAAQAAPAGSGVLKALGHIRLDLALRPDSPAALEFAAHSGAEAASLARLDPAAQLEAVSGLVQAAGASLDARAEALIARKTFTDEDKAELVELSQRWYYLSEKNASEVRSLAQSAGVWKSKPLSAARRMARALQGKSSGDAELVEREMDFVFSGAEALVQASGAKPAELEPYLRRSMDEAMERLRDRGVKRTDLPNALLEDHDEIFGRSSARSLAKALGDPRAWTEFVSAASLRAVEKLEIGYEAHQGKLAKAADQDALRIAVPSWHPLHGRFTSVAERLTALVGPAEWKADGRKLFTIAGIPVHLESGVLLMLGLIAWSSGFGQAAVMAYLFSTILAHELAHAFAARAFGLPTRYITLNPFGGGAMIPRGMSGFASGLSIALAGPAMSLAAGALFVAAGGWLALPAMAEAGRLSVSLAWLNLLPVFPLDGARALLSALGKPLGAARAAKIVSTLGVALSLTLVPYLGFQYILQPFSRAFFIPLWMGIGFAASRALRHHAGTVKIDGR